jgi:mono/diheme cytochrome c family protein
MHSLTFVSVIRGDFRSGRRLIHRLRLIGCWVFLLGAVLCAGRAKAATQEEQDAAYTLYKVRCALCHYIDRPEVKFGPSLKDLFKQEKLINGKPVTEQNVAEWIAKGSENMPAFQYTLSQKEIQTVVSYIKGELGKQSSR